MATIRKLPNCKNWIAQFKNAQGKIVCRSTRIADAGSAKERAEARRNALTIAEAYEKASRGLLGREAAIRDTIMQLVKLAGGPDLKPLTLEEFFAKWIADARKAKKSSTTIARYEQVARDFLNFMGARRNIPFEEVVPDDIQDFVNGLMERLTAKSASNQLKILRIPFSQATRLKNIPNPAAAATLGSTLARRDSVERGVFTTGELARLLATAPGCELGGEWATAIRFGYFCGMRLGDSCSIKWEDLSLAAEVPVIKYTPEKTRAQGRVVELPIHPQLADYLRQIAPEGAEGLITPTLANARRQNLSRWFNNIAAAAGIENEQVKKGARSVSKKSFHALRHSLTSHLTAAGVPAEIRMKFTGHSDLKTHSGYTHHEQRELAAHLNKIEGIAQ